MCFFLCVLGIYPWTLIVKKSQFAWTHQHPPIQTLSPGLPPEPIPASSLLFLPILTPLWPYDWGLVGSLSWEMMSQHPAPSFQRALTFCILDRLGRLHPAGLAAACCLVGVGFSQAAGSGHVPVYPSLLCRLSHGTVTLHKANGGRLCQDHRVLETKGQQTRAFRNLSATGVPVLTLPCLAPVTSSVGCPSVYLQ